MKSLQKIINTLKGLARSYPLVVPLTSIIYGFIFKKSVGIYYGFYAYTCDIINHYIKKLYKNFYGDNEILPILGLGRRPNGAKYCGIFINESNIDGITTSFGMPSGHSQMAVLTAIFWTMYILQNFPNDYHRIITITFISLVTLSIMASRYLLNCHTIRQILMGAIGGLFFGYIGYKIYFNIDLNYSQYINLNE